VEKYQTTFVVPGNYCLSCWIAALFGAFCRCLRKGLVAPFFFIYTREMKSITITLPADQASAYIASLQFVIPFLEQDWVCMSACNFLDQLRADLTTAYAKEQNASQPGEEISSS